ncbi:MAG: hypothetical protein FJ100_14985 [Deltaproteobacteria bacterium]|nr:hypothetical protein [Deltaproteobacteria bacterium]
MKRILATAAYAAMVSAALALGACTTSSGSSGGGGTTTTDTAATATGDATGDTGAAKADATATDTGTAGDASTGAELPKSDTSTPDTTKDTAPPVQKCSPKDQACMNGCSQTACGKESGACLKDPKCTKLSSCLQACDKAELPTDPTATACGKKCLDDAGDTAAKAFYAGQVCLGKKCIMCKKGDQECQGMCASQLCIKQLAACLADTSCTLILDCFGKNKCKDQACAQTCMGKYPAGQATLMGFLQCGQDPLNACDE